ncbi:MAG: glycosyl transferase group 1 [Verrucomicrobia bacterium]|nr:glycosyl transferase group 1 [Verrucomicrobiota bacterium]
MRVCHIVPSLEQRRGGPSVSVPSLAAAQVRGGETVELLATTPGEPECRLENGLTVRTFPLGWPEALSVSRGLQHAVHDSAAEVIHHHGLWLRTLHYAHLGARERGARLVLSPRGMMSPWAWNHHRWRKQAARRFIHPAAFEAVQGWHATSPAEAEEIRALGFGQPVCMAPNGVAAPRADQLIAARAAWLRRCPSAGDRPVALFYSRFHRKKRLRELVDLWLSAPRENWLLMIVGVPEDYSADDVQGWIDRAGGRGRAVVFDGAGQPAPYAVASLFLLPSHSENFGLVIAEAMAAGVPVLVSDATPWSAVNDEDRGWCVPWENFAPALAAALAEGAERLHERGTRARAWVLREFSWDKSAADLAAFYRQLPPPAP